MHTRVFPQHFIIFSVNSGSIHNLWLNDGRCVFLHACVSVFLFCLSVCLQNIWEVTTKSLGMIGRGSRRVAYILRRTRICIPIHFIYIFIYFELAQLSRSWRPRKLLAALNMFAETAVILRISEKLLPRRRCIYHVFVKMAGSETPAAFMKKRDQGSSHRQFWVSTL